MCVHGTLAANLRFQRQLGILFCYVALITATSVGEHHLGKRVRFLDSCTLVTEYPGGGESSAFLLWRFDTHKLG
eukprot:1436678-Amphidinium_carterae.2